MRPLRLLDAFRLRDVERASYGCEGDDTCGVFSIRDIKLKNVLRVIASSDMGWDHVSVSLPHRCPTWDEMEHVKRLFFRDDEWAFQLHAPQADHINCHPHCLHIWRPHDQEIPTPHPLMVAPLRFQGVGA